MSEGKTNTESRDIAWSSSQQQNLQAPTKEELLAAFTKAAEKLPGFTPKRWKGYYGWEESNRCGCAVVAMYLAAGEPLGHADYMDEDDMIKAWVTTVYGRNVFQGITCGFDDAPLHDGCCPRAYWAAKQAAEHFFPPADMAHATA